MDWIVLSDKAILIELGKRIKAVRVQKGFTQRDLAEHIGISVFTITQLEKGNAVSLATFLAVLRTLRLLGNLNLLLPDPEISPVQILKMKNAGNTGQRVRKKVKK